MKKNLILIFALLLSFNSFSQTPRLSEKSFISVITFGPGQEELYSAFGHSGIRVYDSASHLDVAFNYGVFNFEQPHFYLNFARGYLYYMVDAYPYPLFRDFYIQHGRFVHEQILNLTAEQKQRIANYLFTNLQPQNQTYRYDYFYNNCATKVRDAFAITLKDDIVFDSSFIKTNYTIRNLTDLYLGQQPWGDLGIDICLGLPMDKKASPYEYMFLPDYIESSFEHATNKQTNSPLVEARQVITPNAIEKTFNLFHPWVVFGILFVITALITWRDWQEKKLSTWFDSILFFVVGAIGLLLLFLWTLTDHQAAAKNFNLLWALPTHFVVAIFLLFKQKPKWLKSYFLFITILTALLLGFWSLLPQALNVFLIPVVGVILVRAIVNYMLISNK